MDCTVQTGIEAADMLYYMVPGDGGSTAAIYIDISTIYSYAADNLGGLGVY
jgi:hypothetical protein